MRENPLDALCEQHVHDMRNNMNANRVYEKIMMAVRESDAAYTDIPFDIAQANIDKLKRNGFNVFRLETQPKCLPQYPKYVIGFQGFQPHVYEIMYAIANVKLVQL